MTVRSWALRRTELRPFDDRMLLVFAARCALRAEPCFRRLWADAPASADTQWRRGWDFLVATIDGTAREDVDIEQLSRDVLSQGGSGYGALEHESEDCGLLVNRAFNVLSASIDAVACSDRKDLVTQTIVVGKHTASIGAQHAHAGWVTGTEFPEGNAVDHAGITVMNAVRADLERAHGVGDGTFVELDERIGPLWPDGEPPWWCRPPA